MKKIILSFLFLFICATSLNAQITREQADEIVLQYVKNEATPSFNLYGYLFEPSEEGMVITTHQEEIIKIEYASWAYYLNEFPLQSTLRQHRYLFVKEDDGNLLEVITTKDLGPEDLSEWILFIYHYATLSNISVSAGELEPAFSTDIFNYTVTVVEAGEITISATPINEYATVSGIGTFALETGENNFTINVIAEDGVTERNYTILVNNLLDIFEADNSAVRIFPNPTKGELRIWNYELGIENVEIFDIYGRKQKSKIVNLKSEMVIDISHLTAGIYFVKVNTGNGTFVEKFIKN